MALVDDMRLALRATSRATDAEIQMWVDAALADMARVGVRASLLDPDEPSAAVRAAVTCYVKANYGFDNDEASRFAESYRLTVAGLMNGPDNTSADGGEGE